MIILSPTHPIYNWILSNNYTFEGSDTCHLFAGAKQLKAMFQFVTSIAFLATSWACSDFFMNFSDPNLTLSVRTSDLTSYSNWTITTWPQSSTFRSDVINWEDAVYDTIGMTVNWSGDEDYGTPSNFLDSMNEMGLSCSVLALADSHYEERSDDPSKINVFNGVFCLYVTQMFATVDELQQKLDQLVIWGPDIVAEHYVVRDALGMSLVIECVGGEKRVYLDSNDGQETFGIMTNEPTFDYHLMNIKHYEWKRSSLTRQAVATPGNFYPEERYLRIHMIKSGMEELMESTTDMQTAVSLSVQVLNSITVPMGYQYGTDSGSSSRQDHTIFGLVRDHANRVLYWRDAYNPTFRRIRFEDVFASGDSERRSIVVTEGPYFVDMSMAMH